MTIVNVKSFINSVRYAFSGLQYAFRHEQNFRIQIGISIIVSFFMWILDFKAKDVVWVVVIIGSVLVLELINTVMERFLTIVEPKIHTYAKVMKDIMAAAVLLVSGGALIVGSIIFWPYISALF